MAVKTRAQIQAQSNTTYIDNTVGSITPATVRSLNDDWTDSTVFVVQTGSMQVGTASLALTASFVSGSIESASFAAFATTASFALNFNPSATASYALKADSAITASHAVTASFAQTAFLATTASNALTASFVQNAQSASFVQNSVSSSFSTTASFALNFNPTATASFAISASHAVTASFASNVPATSSYALEALTASFAVTASHALKIQNNINATFNSVTASNVQVTGTASIAFLNVEFVSSSIVYSSGSNILGDASNDTQTLFGTVNVITGPLKVTGSANFQGGLTGSLLGTASFASQALSSSFATTASFASNVPATASFAITSSFAVTASFASNVASASFATTASFAQNANLAAVANSALSSNFASSSVSASFATTASFLTATVQSASFAQTASFLNTIRQPVVIMSASFKLADLNGPKSVTIDADSNNDSLTINSNLYVPLPYAYTGSAAGLSGFASQLSASFAQTASFVQNAQTASFVLNAVSASFAATASFVALAQTASRVTSSGVFGPSGANSVLTSSFAVTASFALNAAASPAFPFTGSAEITGSLIVSGSTRGSVFSGSISSATCSIDFRNGNFFTSVISGSTFINVTNVNAGQTVNLLLTTAGTITPTASFSANVKQPTGSLYTPSSGSGRIDLLSFVAFDTGSVYLVATKTLS